MRKTHTRKDGTFIDERAEALVLEVEKAVEEMLQEGSPVEDGQTDSTAATTTSKRLLLNQEYIKVIISPAHYLCLFLLFFLSMFLYSCIKFITRSDCIL